MAFGAQGIEMGTRFIATQECTHAHPVYKRLIVEKSEMDTVVIKRSLGAPGRAINTALARKIIEMEAKGATYAELKDLISGAANQKLIYEGREEEGFGWAGQGMGLIEDIPTVAQLIERIVEQARESLNHCQRSLG